MARTLEQLDKDLTAALDTVDKLAGRIDELEAAVKGVNDAVSHTPNNEALPADHVLTPSRKGLPDYEEARIKLQKMKPGDSVQITHLGKSIAVNYAQGRELLRQAQIA